MKVTIDGRVKIPMKKNSMVLTSKNGKPRMIKDQKVKNFEEYLAWIATGEMKRNGFTKPFEKPVKLHLEVVFGDNYRRDLQNCFGSVCDALNGIVYADDCQIVSLSATKRVEYNQWSFRIIVAEIEEDSKGAA